MSLIQQTEEEGTFRDNLSTIHKDGSRNWIYVQKPAGRYYNKRTVVSIVLLAFLFLAPFVRVGGNHPLMLFNIIERKFVLFGVPFWPQDFYLVVLIVLTVLVTFVLFTAIFGRIWCGWLCPQTIFLEMLFRKIEYAIEGSAVKQKMLDASPLSGDKIFKKGLKHTVFFILSFTIANTFLAYIIGSDQLITIITDPIGSHIVGLATITIFSLVFYAVFARFREQACIVVCPYGRYMSSLVDEDTIAVTYDFARGEPRKKFSKEDKLQKQGIAAVAPAAPRGDCIDCHQCVNVCPTGIDIRNGIQLECVNCTACMDACDTIMTKIDKPKGLIRYTSFNAVKDGIRHKIKPRIYAYAVVLLVLLTTVSYLFATRPDLDILILRQPGTMFEKSGTNNYVNFYIFQGINKTYNDLPVEIRLIAPQEGSITMLGTLSPIIHQTAKELRFILSLPKRQLTSSQTKVRFALVSNGKIIKEVESSFVGPEKP
jgi:cytochrome c oxidase accessory protein FixG